MCVVDPDQVCVPAMPYCTDLESLPVNERDRIAPVFGGYLRLAAFLISLAWDARRNKTGLLTAVVWQHGHGLPVGILAINDARVQATTADLDAGGPMLPNAAEQLWCRVARAAIWAAREESTPPLDGS